MIITNKSFVGVEIYVSVSLKCPLSLIRSKIVAIQEARLRESDAQVPQHAASIQRQGRAVA